jgi:hypothetical protein
MSSTRQQHFTSLSFLTGRWAGDGFVIHFTDPLNGMMFGSLQESDGGRTVYWETFRIVLEEDGNVMLYPVKLGTPLGLYRLVALETGRRMRAVFEDPYDPDLRRLIWSSDDAGSSLVARIEGEKDGEPYVQEWAARRAELT